VQLHETIRILNAKPITSIFVIFALVGIITLLHLHLQTLELP